MSFILRHAWLLLPALLAPAAAAETAGTPRVLIVAQSEGTEITDLLVPYAVLSAAGAHVSVVARQSGPVKLWPALTLHVDTALREADPAELIVVPAVRTPDAPELLAWLRKRHGDGTRIASICDGVLVLAESGLLDDRRATGHFFSDASRRRDYPAVQWVRDRRWVEDGPFLSSAGVSASGPAAVRLVERLFGEERAAHVAERYGIDRGAAHRTDDFRIGLSEIMTGVSGLLRSVFKRRYVLHGSEGMDEFSLAFAVDLLGRTSRASLHLRGDDMTLRTEHGLKLYTADPAIDGRILLLPSASGTPHSEPDPALAIDDPATAVDQLLAHITDAFGARTAEFVAIQLELPVGDRSGAASATRAAGNERPLPQAVTDETVAGKHGAVPSG